MSRRCPEPRWFVGQYIHAVTKYTNSIENYANQSVCVKRSNLLEVCARTNPDLPGLVDLTFYHVLVKYFRLNKTILSFPVTLWDFFGLVGREIFMEKKFIQHRRSIKVDPFLVQKSHNFFFGSELFDMGWLRNWKRQYFLLGLSMTRLGQIRFHRIFWQHS